VTPAWPALAEAVWLSGNRDATLEAVRRAEAEGTAGWNPWAIGDLALWAFLAGGGPAAALTIAEPYALILNDKADAAAQQWEQRRCPYEVGIALSTSKNPDSVLRGIRTLDELGAMPAASYARRRLRDLG
jgi:hypothetical protein